MPFRKENNINRYSTIEKNREAACRRFFPRGIAVENNRHSIRKASENFCVITRYRSSTGSKHIWKTELIHRNNIEVAFNKIDMSSAPDGRQRLCEAVERLSFEIERILSGI